MNKKQSKFTSFCSTVAKNKKFNKNVDFISQISYNRYEKFYFKEKYI